MPHSVININRNNTYTLPNQNAHIKFFSLSWRVHVIIIAMYVFPFSFLCPILTRTGCNGKKNILSW